MSDMDQQHLLLLSIVATPGPFLISDLISTEIKEMPILLRK